MKITLFSNYSDSLPAEFGDKDGTLTVYVDNKVMLVDENARDPIALMVEPRSIFPKEYEWLEENHNRFKYIFTLDSRLLQLPNAKLFLYGQIIAEFPDAPKDKLISMTASNKDFCEGHRRRKRVAEQLKGIIDTYGRFDGGEFCTDEDYLKGYRFNVAMENYSDGYYFTEKICNCFASRIVPIYYGCPKEHLAEYFNLDGVVYCDSPEEVIRKTKEILINPESQYFSRIDAIEDNFKRVQKFRRFAPLFLDTYKDLLENLT